MDSRSSFISNYAAVHIIDWEDTNVEWKGERRGEGGRIPFRLKDEILEMHPALHLRSVHPRGRGWLNYLRVR